MTDTSWLAWLALGAIAMVMLFAQIRLFFIDSKAQAAVDRMDQILSELKKIAAK